MCEFKSRRVSRIILLQDISHCWSTKIRGFSGTLSYYNLQNLGFWEARDPVDAEMLTGEMTREEDISVLPHGVTMVHFFKNQGRKGFKWLLLVGIIIAICPNMCDLRVYDMISSRGGRLSRLIPLQQAGFTQGQPSPSERSSTSTSGRDNHLKKED